MSTLTESDYSNRLPDSSEVSAKFNQRVEQSECRATVYFRRPDSTPGHDFYQCELELGHSGAHRMRLEK